MISANDLDYNHPMLSIHLKPTGYNGGIVKTMIERGNHQCIDFDRLLRRIFHDLKAPVRSIYTLVNWLEEDNRDQLNPESLENMNLLKEKARDALALLENIQEYSRVRKMDRTQSWVTLKDLFRTLPQEINGFKIESDLKFYCRSKMLKTAMAKIHAVVRTLADNNQMEIKVGIAQEKEQYLILLMVSCAGFSQMEHLQNIDFLIAQEILRQMDGLLYYECEPDLETLKVFMEIPALSSNEEVFNE